LQRPIGAKPKPSSLSRDHGEFQPDRQDAGKTAPKQQTPWFVSADNAVHHANSLPSPCFNVIESRDVEKVAAELQQGDGHHG
jgi:hypothetical protein